MVSKNTQDQKKKDLKNQYQVADLKEFDLMHHVPQHTHHKGWLLGSNGVKKYITKVK